MTSKSGRGSERGRDASKKGTGKFIDERVGADQLGQLESNPGPSQFGLSLGLACIYFLVPFSGSSVERARIYIFLKNPKTKQLSIITTVKIS